MAKRDEKERFMAKVEKTDGCWLWMAGRMSNGYGQFRLSNTHELAHRTSYRLFKGPIDAGLLVMHSCDNPSCVNPAHLSAGTQKQNMADASIRGRSARGEGHGRCKLTAGKVKVIRLMSMSQRRIAAYFNVSQSQISDIKRGNNWGHLAA